MKLAFYKGRDRFFNRAVCWWLRGPYSHVELILSTDEAGISECASSSYMDGGVRVKYMILNPDHWDLVEVGGSEFYSREWLEAHKGEGYDVLGLLGFLWKPLREVPKLWFCSEAVAAMLGWREPWRLDPMTLRSATSNFQPDRPE